MFRSATSCCIFLFSVFEPYFCHLLLIQSPSSPFHFTIPSPFSGHWPSPPLTPPILTSLFLFPPLFLQRKRYFTVNLKTTVDLLASVPVAGRDQRRKCLHLQQQWPVLLQHRQLDVTLQDPEPEGPHPQQPGSKGMQWVGVLWDRRAGSRGVPLIFVCSREQHHIYTKSFSWCKVRIHRVTESPWLNDS